MRTTPLVMAAALFITAIVASAQSITYDFDSSVDFATIHTYAWIKGTTLGDELNHKRVVAAIDRQLAQKGLARIESPADADVVVAYHATFDRDLQINGFSSGWAGYRFGGNRTGTARTEQLLVGTLAVDVMSPKSKTIVWRGIATKDVDVNAKPEKREKNINKTAEKLFKNYPPRS